MALTSRYKMKLAKVMHIELEATSLFMVSFGLILASLLQTALAVSQFQYVDEGEAVYRHLNLEHAEHEYKKLVQFKKLDGGDFFALKRRTKEDASSTYKKGVNESNLSECSSHNERCSKYAICGLAEGTNEPVCLCEKRVMKDLKDQPVDSRVCGSDGKSYANPFDLEFYSCLYGLNVTTVRTTQCLSRPRYYQENTTRTNCSFDGAPTSNTSEMVLINECYKFPSDEHVCGSDRVVYENRCALEQYNCKKDTEVFPTDLKYCLKANVPRLNPTEFFATSIDAPMSECLARNINCSASYSTCAYWGPLFSAGPLAKKRSRRPVAKDPKFHCKCQPLCVGNERKIVPTCGTDHEIHLSSCELRRRSCIKRHWIEEDKHTVNCLKPTVFFDQKYVSKYDTTPLTTSTTPKPTEELPMVECKAANLACSIYATCALDYETQKPSCKCTNRCQRWKRPVCGSDSRTYFNLCEMQWLSCLRGANITFGYNWECNSTMPQFEGELTEYVPINSSVHHLLEGDPDHHLN